ESRQRLHSVGLHKPQVVDPYAKGRQAAAVEPDRWRAHRLYAAVMGTLSSTRPDGELVRKRQIALIGTDRLKSELQDEFEVIRLQPGLAGAQFDADAPTGLIIEEAALHNG